MFRVFLPLVPLAGFIPGAVLADTASIKRGQELVQNHCSRCHAIGETGQSPFSDAPLFRDLATRYDVEDLSEAFAEGIVVGHPAMPVFEFAPDKVGDLIAYLKTL